MNVGETIDLLVSTDDYLNVRSKISDQFIEMMKFMYSEKYKLIEGKEESYNEFILRFSEIIKK